VHRLLERLRVLLFLALQPIATNEIQEFDYDSADSAVSDLSEGEEEDEDVFDSGVGAEMKESKRQATKENTEHSNPYSYAWLIMRLAVMKLVQDQLQDFLNVAGIELQGKDHKPLIKIASSRNFTHGAHQSRITGQQSTNTRRHSSD